MIYRAVTYSGVFHISDYLFEGVKILKRISVQLYIGNMSSVGEFMIRSFYLYLVKGVYIVIYGNVETVGIIVSIRNSLYDAVLFFIYPHESSREAFCRSRYERPVEACLPRHFIHAFSHIAYYLKTQYLRFF